MVNQDIVRISNEMIRLLETTAELDWAASLKRIQLRVQAATASHTDYQRVLRDILAMLGGMGSLSDLVLYNEGLPLKAENDELAHLRHRLFEAARADLQ